MTSCVRKAWLTLGTLSVLLEDSTKGYFCTELNLGYPAAREVINNRPDQDGADDRTQYMGSRAVTANISALAGAGARIDTVASQFAPFMVPSARPTLHYILDRPGAAERTMTLRASNYAWPIIGSFQRDIQLAWVCSDPYAADPNQSSASAYAGSSTSPGRLYNLIFPRVYPVGGGSATTGQILPKGDLSVQPIFQIWGPITAPVITLNLIGGGGGWQIKFLPPLIINANHYVEIDTYAKTVRMDGDPMQSQSALLDWQNTTWPVCPPVPPTQGTYLQLSGGSTSVITQVKALWHDRYLS